MTKRSKKNKAARQRPVPASHSLRDPRAGQAEDPRVQAYLPTIVEHLNKGEVTEGMRLIQSAMRLAPQHPELSHLAGQVMMMSMPDSERVKAQSFLQRAVELAPKNAQYRVTLANALRVDMRYEEALAEARRAIKIDPGFAPAHTTVGVALAKLNRQREAAEAFANAARIEPGNPESWLNLALCRMELREADAVVAAIERIEQLVPDPSAELLRHLGMIYRGLGRYNPAERYLRRAIAKQPDSGDLWFAVAEVLLQTGDLEAADAALDEAERLGHPAANIRFTRARILGQQGRIEQAKNYLEQALAAAWHDPSQLLAIAAEYALLGDFDAQERCLTRVLDIEPGNVSAYASLVVAPGRDIEDREIPRLEKITADPIVDSATRSQVAFTLGDHFRHAKSYDQSFHYFKMGNRLKGFKFDERAYRDWQSRITAGYTKALFEQSSGSGNSSTLPILIVGMPRSGTTLVEQIASAHPEIVGAGELGTVARLAGVDGLEATGFEAPIDQVVAAPKDRLGVYAVRYLEAMNAVASGADGMHVTNKLPHNFQQLGLFALLFPKAPIIHVKRDPRDNLLSLYFQDFRGAHAYAYDLKSLGRYYRLYEDLMAHWAAVMPNPIMHLQYEELVQDLPGMTANLAAFLGVELDEKMLRFWEQDRKVKTASLWQVRQPLYTSSIGRWKPYQKHLKPLFDALDL